MQTELLLPKQKTKWTVFEIWYILSCYQRVKYTRYWSQEELFAPQITHVQKLTKSQIHCWLCGIWALSTLDRLFFIVCFLFLWWANIICSIMHQNLTREHHYKDQGVENNIERDNGFDKLADSQKLMLRWVWPLKLESWEYYWQPCVMGKMSFIVSFPPRK